MSVVIKQSAELLYKDELDRLRQEDSGDCPPGWQLSGQAVCSFILGDKKLGITQKFYGDDALVERAVVTLMGHQSLLLVGEPGTAKSLLSELLGAAISGDSQKIIQGTAGTTEDHIKYSWNYALLLAQGPNEQSLIPGAIYNAMSEGAIARFEEVTRCPQEVQDALISLMSEKQIYVPELSRAQSAKPGFNIIATANLHDKGVNEMSNALRRRFNFETVRPIRDPELEKTLIRSQLAKRFEGAAPSGELDDALLDILVAVFNDLRGDKQAAVKSLDAVLSTAEAVNVAYACCLQHHYMGGELDSGHIAQQLQGVVIKDKEEERKKLAHYLDVFVRERARKDAKWKAFFQSGKSLWMN
ncbi:ATP-binding protein [Porticoccus sp. GXU_MW_L64]